MKIIYVITKSNWGGAQKYVYDLATSLPKGEYDSVVVFGGAGPLAEKLTRENIRTVSIPRLGRDMSFFADVSSFFKLISIFKKEKPDVVSVNSSKVGGLGALAARITKVPRIVFTCHGWAFNENRNLFSLWLIRFFSWLTVMSAHETITVSERDFHDGSHMLWAKNKMTLVHNGIKVPNFKEKAESRAFISDLAKNRDVGVDVGVVVSENDFLIGAIGELHKNKAYEYILEAIPLLKQKNIPAKLVVMGEGEERKELELLITKLGIEKDVSLVGFVRDAPQYLKAFDALILSSIKEGLPYVIIEAGLAGLPVVATSVGGVKEIIDDMKSGILVQTRKPIDTASALELIYSNHEKALQFGQNLKHKIETGFSLSEMVRKTVVVYKSK